MSASTTTATEPRQRTDFAPDTLRDALGRALQRETDPDVRCWLAALLADGDDQRDPQADGVTERASPAAQQR
jgi:hypothetical protein